MSLARSLAAALPLALLVSLPAAGGGDGTAHLTFEGLNHEYHNGAAEMAPVQQGPMVIRLSSPGSAVTLHRHRLTLTPLPDGSHRAWLELEISGHGTVVADLYVSGLASRQEDELTVPAQDHSLEGRVAVARSGDGYRFTALELPATFEVRFESQLAGRLLGTCRALAAVPLMPLDCDALERRLSTAVLPLPPPGESFLLPDALLAEAERSALDRYLGRAGRR